MDNKLKTITEWLDSLSTDNNVPAQPNQQQANAGIYLAAFLASNVDESVVAKAIDFWSRHETRPDNLTRALLNGHSDGSAVAGIQLMKDFGEFQK